MKHIRTAALVCLAFALAACGGGGHLSVDTPGGGERHETHTLNFPPGEPREYRLPFRISGGIPPYESRLLRDEGEDPNCPDWVTLLPDQRILAGTAPVTQAGMTFFCVYRVTESDPGFRPQRSVSHGLRLKVGPLNDLEFTESPRSAVNLSVGIFHSNAFPAASGGVPPYTYSFRCAGDTLPSGLPSGMGFAPETRTFAGTPGTLFQDSCTYKVTDNSVSAKTKSSPVEVVVGGPVTGTLMLDEFVVPGNVLRLRVDERARVAFRKATGGVPPYTHGLHCSQHPPAQFPGPINLPPDFPTTVLPPGLGFDGLTQVLSGTPGSSYGGPDCTYWVTDSATPPATLARSVALIIDPARAKWRFPDGDRSLAQEDIVLDRKSDADRLPVRELPVAVVEGEPQPQDALPVYRLDNPQPLLFDSDANARRLEYIPGTNPPLGKTTTYRYQVLFGDTVDDTLCIDVSFRDGEAAEEDATIDPLIASIRIRDDAHYDGEQYLCPDAPLQPSSASSNPVHEALGPVHARRALDVAHGAVRDRVRGWTPGAPRALTAIAPTVGIGSLSGESDGFDYTGSSESVSAGAEIGSGSWQAGLVGSYTRTELHYRAAAGLAERGYRAGEHTTEILSLHPFAAWHMPSGGSVWTSLGAGAGQLRHRDDLGFPSWSRSDVQLRAYAAGGSVPVADILSGALEAEAGIEAFAFEIEGGGRISSALPTLRGRDYRAGLAWSAPIAGAPSLSVAYRHLTGRWTGGRADGDEGLGFRRWHTRSPPQR